MKNNVRYYREKKNMTQSELASLVGVQSQTIWNIEHAKGKAKPHPRTLRKLSEVLGVSVEELFSSDDSEVEPAA